MKHRLLYFLLLLPLHLHAADLTLDGARQLAERYYAVLERAASQPEEARVVFDRELVSIFGIDINGKSVEDQFWVANDADAVFGANGGKLSSISVEDYITKIRSYAKTRKVRLEHELLDCFYLKGPSLDKKEQAPYIEVLVRRTLYRDGIRMEEFIERMDIKVSTAFPFIGNKYGSMPESAEGAIATAYSLYGQEEYDEAFRMFQHALKMQPSNKDASYRLGVMCYQGKGCKQYPGKVRNRMAEFYWQKSEKGRTRLILESYNRLMTNLIGSIYTGLETDPFPSNRMLVVNFKDDYGRVKCGYMNKKGKMVIAQTYPTAFPFFTNGTALVYSDRNEWLLIDTMGRIQSVFSHVFAEPKYFRVKTKELYGYIDRKTGNYLMPPLYSSEVVRVNKNLDTHAYRLVKKDGLWGIYDWEYGEVVACKYKNIEFTLQGKNYIYCIVNYNEEEFQQLLSKYKNAKDIPWKEWPGKWIKISHEKPDQLVIENSDEQCTITYLKGASSPTRTTWPK